jgi:hypothetical protein
LPGPALERAMDETVDRRLAEQLPATAGDRFL